MILSAYLVIRCETILLGMPPYAVSATGSAASAGGPRPSNGSRPPVRAMCCRILSTTSGSVITLTIFISVPHLGHESGSISKILCSSRAQLTRALHRLVFAVRVGAVGPVHGLVGAA